jgi:hypothetical protein
MTRFGKSSRTLPGMMVKAAANTFADAIVIFLDTLFTP